MIGAALGLTAAGAALSWIGYAWAPHALTLRCVWRAPRGAGRRIALTFDDGPDPEVTPRVLDLLDAAGARATFFCIGRRVDAHPEIAAEIVRRGHGIGNHTQTHPNLFACYPAPALRHEIERAQQAAGPVPVARPPAIAADPRGSARQRDPLRHEPAVGSRQPEPGADRVGSRHVVEVTPGVLRPRTSHLGGGDAGAPPGPRRGVDGRGAAGDHESQRDEPEHGPHRYDVRGRTAS